MDHLQRHFTQRFLTLHTTLTTLATNNRYVSSVLIRASVSIINEEQHQCVCWLTSGVAARLTIVSEQRLRRTLTVWAGGVRAATAVKADATVGATVTLTSQHHMASIYAALKNGGRQPS